MAECSKEGFPAKSVRGKEFEEASDLLHRNCRHPRHRISKPSSSLGCKLRRKLCAPSSPEKSML
jgi:hypothetical protein